MIVIQQKFKDKERILKALLKKEHSKIMAAVVVFSIPKAIIESLNVGTVKTIK